MLLNLPEKSSEQGRTVFAVKAQAYHLRKYPLQKHLQYLFLIREDSGNDLCFLSDGDSDLVE